MKKPKRPALPRAAQTGKAAALCTALAAAVLAALLSGCMGSAAGGTAPAGPAGSAPAEDGLPQPTPSPCAEPAGEEYTPGPQPGFEELPPDARFTLTWTNPDTLESEVRLLQGGEMLPEGSTWVTDTITGKIAARAERRTEADEGVYLLYDLEGTLLLNCGQMQPAALFGHWVILGDKVRLQQDGEAWLDGQLIDLADGEVWMEHCYLYGEVSDGVWLVTGIQTAEAPAPAPMLVNEQMEVLRRFDGAFDGWAVTRNWTRLPGIVQLVYHTEEDTAEHRLYSLARDEMFPGEYRGLVAGDLPLGCFSVGQEAFLIRLDTGEAQAIPQPEDAWQQYVAITSEASAYYFTGEKGESRGSCLETAGGVLSAAKVELMPCGWFVYKTDGTILVLDRAGRQQETWSLPTSCKVIGWPDPTFALLCWEGGWRLYNAGGPCGEGSADDAWMSDFGGGRYLLYARQERDVTYSLLNEEGQMLLEELDEIGATEVPGVFSVRRGGEVGLMDETGRWLWRDSVSTLFGPVQAASQQTAG